MANSKEHELQYPLGDQLPALGSTLDVAPTLMAGSMNLLTTAGTSLLDPRNVTAQVVSSAITVTGQLYVAILIALILGRFHRRRG